ncbi:MAG: hypothetical protein ACRDTC_22320, partial [Pseudonocardiaceae bacterium]
MLGALQSRTGYTIGTTEYHTADVSLTANASFEELAYQACTRRSWGFRLITPVSFATTREEGARRERPWP